LHAIKGLKLFMLFGKCLQEFVCVYGLNKINLVDSLLKLFELLDLGRFEILES
jgi:hypothetical protein